MFCVKCGKELKDNARFCTKCGAPQKVKEAELQTKEMASLAPSEPTQPDTAEPKFTQPPEMAKPEPSKPKPAPEPLPTAASPKVKKPEKKKKSTKLIVLLICLAAVAAAGAGAVYFLGSETVRGLEPVPETAEAAASYFEIRFEELDEKAENKQWLDYHEKTEALEEAINQVYLSEDGERPYIPDVLALTEEAAQTLDEKNSDYGYDVLTALNEENKFTEMGEFYASFMLTDDNRDEMVDMMFHAFLETGQLAEADLMLRELLSPFTAASVAKSMEYRTLLEEAYPEWDKSYIKLNGHLYDQVLNFSDGTARVALNRGSGGNKIYEWGLINTEGDEIIAPRYQVIGGYLEGLAAVQENDKWGFVDERGNVVIPPQYDDLKDTQDAIFYAYAIRDPENVLRGFYDGFAAVQKDGRWGFIDKNGQELGRGIIYQDVWYFNEGYAAVEIDNKYGLIDSNGRYVIEPDTYGRDGINYDVVRPIYEGLAGANWNGRSERGLVNKEGYLVAAFDKSQIDLVQDFREGLASVRKHYGSNAKWGFINTQGRIVIPTKYDTVTVFIDGISKVSNDGLYGLIGRSGQEILPLQYTTIGDFTNDYAIIKRGGMFGFVSKSGSVLVEPRYENVTDFADGLACVKTGGKWGVINTEGQVVLEPVFDEMKQFGNGVAPAKLNSKWGYVDSSGYFVVAPVFEKAYTFSDGLASVSEDGEKYYFIGFNEIASNLDGKAIDEDGNPISNAEVQVYGWDDARMKECLYATSTAPDGMFKIVLPEGRYKLVVKKEGYISGVCYEEIHQLIDNYGTTITLVGVTKEKELSASVRIGDALTGTGVDSAEVHFRQGYNNEWGNYVRGEDGAILTAFTDRDGIFTVSLPAGLYTAESELEGYTTVYINFTVGEKSRGQQIKTQAMTTVLPEGETRITLEWGSTPADLDSHLTGPIPDSYEKFHIYYPVKGLRLYDAMLDKDDIMGNGFETTTIYKQEDGTYRYSVFDYTNQGNYSSSQMSLSGARVSVYRGNTCVAVFDVPVNRTGNLWEVFELNGDEITPINNVTSHHDITFYTY